MGGPRTGGLVLDARAEWWAWWDRNKLDFLRPRRPWLEAPLTGGDGANGSGTAASARRERRAELAGLLEGFLRDGDYNVRSSALIGLGRLDGAGHVAAFREALRDPHPQVRDAAVLALGVSGRGEAIPDLLRLAWDAPSGGGEGASDVPAHTRGMALAALGIARARGASDRASELARSWLRDASLPRRREAGAAAGVALTLSRDAGSVQDLVAVARDTEQPSPVRARALTALGAIGDAAGRETIGEGLGDRDLEVRRAAAVALGGIARRGDGEAISRLRAFVGKEGDVAARGFALMALGRLGARDALLEEVERGPEVARSWAFLALAVAVAGAPDEGALRVLKTSLAKERSSDRRGACAIALGIAGDDATAGILADSFRTERDPHLRGLLAQALALTRAAQARIALLEAVRSESSAYVRAIASFALAFFADPRDVEPLLAAVRANRISSLMGLHSLALAFHGGEGAYPALLGLLRDPETPAIARAAAIDGAVLLLEEDPIPVLHRVARESNYLADPEVVEELLKFLL
ncbi:MAG TPA: HEAT repeat domain-containing protein [Planctomycetota bacterium]|jgi:HEAT repeat protein|nr:HEAT repeat domain-containing protein [Planctomycetota bacterium]